MKMPGQAGEGEVEEDCRVADVIERTGEVSRLLFEIPFAFGVILKVRSC